MASVRVEIEIEISWCLGEERPIEDETLASILENETLRWGNGGVHKTQEEMNLNVVVFDFEFEQQREATKKMEEFWSMICGDSVCSEAAVLDVLHFPGAIFLLLCTYNVSKYEDNDGENEECLYVPLSDQLNEVDPISHVTPFAKAGFFSKISFIVQKKTLKDEDIPKLPESDQAESCYLFVFCRSIEQAEKKGTIVTKIVFVGNNSVTSERDFDVRTFCFAQGVVVGGILKPWIKRAYGQPADLAGQTRTVRGLSGANPKILHPLSDPDSALEGARASLLIFTGFGLAKVCRTTAMSFQVQLMDAGCQSNCVGAHRIDVTSASIARLYGRKLRSITVAVRNVGTTGEDLFDVTPGFVVLKAFLGFTKAFAQLGWIG
ncbi:hypothetical protein JHK82_044675 [Glycine max]|nr:hypothetical protein JHK82_044675 [Glycine max]